MEPNHLLSQLSIPTPCPMEWEHMPGDERRRFCESCGKHVYDLTTMSPDELLNVTSRAIGGEHGLCGRIALKSNGPPQGSEGPQVVRARGARQFTIRWLMLAIAGCAARSGVHPAPGIPAGGAAAQTLARDARPNSVRRRLSGHGGDPSP